MPDLVLQRIVAALPAKPEALYFRARGGVSCGADRATFVLAPGAELDLDTYFGSFFESHWRRHGSLPSLRFRLDVTGRARVRLWRTQASRELLAEQNVQDGRLQIDVPDGRGDGPSRLHVSIDTATGATVHDGGWVCAGDGSAVKLVAGFCAFGERDRALSNAASLARDPSLDGKLARIVIVDQSGHAAAATAMPDGITVLRQANFGGTGGFTRVMLAALDCAGASHVVLLDDDVDIDPECVRRAWAFLAIAAEQPVLAGQMLDLLQPHLVHEAGARLDPARLRLEAHSRGVDATRDLAALMAHAPIDYAAWFFCVVPLAALRRCGLPLPLFINFDDVELGIRLSAGGTPATSIPGLCVWHRPGYVKDDGWRNYYYHRNMAVIAAVHGVTGSAGLAGNFARRAAKALQRGDLFKLALSCDALSDFLAGPAALPAVPATTLVRIGRRQRDLPTAWRGIGGLIPASGLALRAAGVLLMVLARGRRAIALWHDARKTLSSPAWWQGYLGKGSTTAE